MKLNILSKLTQLMLPNQTEKLRFRLQLAIFLLVCGSLLLYRLYLDGVIDFRLLSIKDLNPFGGLNMMYDWLMDPAYQPDIYAPAFLLATAIIVLALVGGRFFCGWICPFGALNDYINSLGRRILGKSFEVPPYLNRSLGYVKYLILIYILGSKLLMGSCPLANFDPWLAFFNLPGLPDTLGDIPFAFVVLLLVSIGAFFISRFYCRYLCPLAALQAILAGTGFVQFKERAAVSAKHCGNCRVCSLRCPVDLKLREVEIVASPECINCMNCVGEACPRGSKAFEVMLFNRRVKNYSYILVAFAIFFGIYSCVGLASNSHGVLSTTLGTRVTYRDGTYYGTGVGFAPGIQVQVEVRGERIQSIQVLKHHETSGYYEEPFKITITQIVKNQSVTVDAVSGATYTSRGLVEAVTDALKKAKP